MTANMKTLKVSQYVAVGFIMVEALLRPREMTCT